MSSPTTTPRTCKKCGKQKTPNDFYKSRNVVCKDCLRKTRKPRTKESRREEYRRQAIKDDTMTRAGVAYITTAPIDNLRWCTKCKKYLPTENFRKKKIKHSRFDSTEYYETLCLNCERRRGREKYVPHRRPKRTKEEKRVYQENTWINQFLKRYLSGDGCCLYCGKTDFWKLNNHHLWGRKNSDFTVTLCENHHSFFTRGLPFLLEEWY